jgi:hypothetical protein
MTSAMSSKPTKSTTIQSSKFIQSDHDQPLSPSPMVTRDFSLGFLLDLARAYSASVAALLPRSYAHSINRAD